MFSHSISVVQLFANSEKIEDVVVDNLMQVPIDIMVSKPKIRGCPDQNLESENC